MACSSEEQAGPTVLLSLLGALSRTTVPSCIYSTLEIRLGHFGITRTYYCEGLRGPMIIYDPLDPHAGLYDVGDGM